MPPVSSNYPRHGFPHVIISDAIRLYYRSTLSFRDAEPPRLARHHRPVRNRPALASDLRSAYERRHRRYPEPVGDTWYLDEVRDSTAGVSTFGRRWIRRVTSATSCSSPPGSPGGHAVLSQTPQSVRPGTTSPRHRSPRRLRCHTQGCDAVQRPRHRALRQRPLRNFASVHTLS